MAFNQKHPLALSTTAWTIFALTAIVPVGYILAQFFINFFSNQISVTNVLIDARQLVLLGRSVKIALSATLVALAIGVPVAFCLAAKDLPCKKLFYFLVIIPVSIPPYIMAGAWIHLLSPTGWLNNMLTGCFGPSAKLSLYSIVGCSWILGLSFFPIIAFIVATGLSQIDSNLTDIARLSTNRWGVFRWSILPQILPHLLASICLVMIFVLGQYGVPSLLGINTYPVEIFTQFSAFYDDNAAVAAALPLIVLVIFLILLQRWVMQNYDYVRITPASETKNPIKLNKAKYYTVGILIIFFVAAIILPFLSVLSHANSLEKVWVTICSYGSGIITTSIFALLAAIVSVAIAFPIGHYLAHNQSRLAKVLDIVCWLPIAIPGTIIGLGIIKLSNGISILQRFDSFGFFLVFAYIGMFSAFAIRIFQASYKRSDPNISEAADLDCCRWYQHLLHIDIPIHLPAIAASMIVVFVLVLGELNATVLLIPPGKATLAVSIDNLLHYGANATASALCLIETGLIIGVIVLGFFVWTSAKRLMRNSI